MISVGSKIQDDRSKDDRTLVVSSIIWQDENHALVRVDVDLGVKDGEFSLRRALAEPLLIDGVLGNVLNSQYDSWVVMSPWATDTVGG